MYGYDILCGISKGTIEIPHKISYPYIERCRFYSQVNFRALKLLKSSSVLLNPHPGFIISRCTTGKFLLMNSFASKRKKYVDSTFASPPLSHDLLTRVQETLDLRCGLKFKPQRWCNLSRLFLAENYLEASNPSGVLAVMLWYRCVKEKHRFTNLPTSPWSQIRCYVIRCMLCSDIISTFMCLKPPANRLFLQQFVHAMNEGNIKAPHYRPFVSWIHPWPDDSPYKGPLMRKAFPCHDATVS